MNVLQNLDLLNLIFSYLAILNTSYSIERDTHLSKSGQQSLLCAGLATKTFFEPAINLLWYEMDSRPQVYGHVRLSIDNDTWTAVTIWY